MKFLWRKKGQVSSEIIFIVALILILTLPFIGGVLNNLQERVQLENKVQKAMEVAQALETISNLGEGSSIDIISEENMIIEGGNLILKGDDEEGVENLEGIDYSKDIVVPLTYNFENNFIERGSLKIININGDVNIKNFPEVENIIGISSETSESGILKIYKHYEIKGKHFDETSKVYFDGKEIEDYESLDDLRIRFEAPHSELGEYLIYVSNIVSNEEMKSNEYLLTRSFSEADRLSLIT
jgi:hypothetical protein